MYKLLFKQLLEKIILTPEEEEIIKSYFTPKKLRKRQFLLQEGDICNRITFIEKGALYSYTADERGTQHILSFHFEGGWAGDLQSILSKEPTRFNIEVLEDCELLQLSPENEEILFAKVRSFESFVRINYRNAVIALQERVQGTLGLSAEERYSRLLQQYPLITTRVPLHLIASYLGVTPETLSRKRRQLARSPSLY